MVAWPYSAPTEVIGMAENTGVLSSERILVVAPHPDDESLGCGGLIAKLAARGRTFCTAFITDGGASHRGSLTWSRERLAARREQEAVDALQHLGIGAHAKFFFRLLDADMPAIASAEWQSALKKLEKIVRTFHPDLVLLPWRRDPHCDHRNSWRLARTAIRQTPLTPMILEYTIWLDELGAPQDYPRENEVEYVVVDVSSEREQKRAAVAAHLSQMGNLIDDDPDGFRLSPATIDRLTGTSETYWRALDEGD